VKTQYSQPRLLGVSSVMRLRNPNPEIPNAFDSLRAGRPTHARSAKSLGFFGFRNSDFLRVSVFGLRLSRAARSPVRNLGEPRLLSASLRAFTLIEVIISAALMALIVVSAYLCLNAAVCSQKMIEPRATVFQNARVAMALIAADLRCACPLSKDSAFLGMHRMIGTMEADNLDFATHNYTPRRPHEGDYCQVSLYLDKDPESGQFALYRRRNPALALDPLSGGKREEIAQGLLGLRFDYYDGFDWYENWGEVDRRSQAKNSRRERYNLAGMPQAVRITLWFDSNPKTKPAVSQGAPAAGPSTDEPAPAPPFFFQTVARLNLATTSENVAGSSPDAGGQSAPQRNSGGGNP
jgi:prepilin-type N-terminal cleavage/methylation domain-containing protein